MTPSTASAIGWATELAVLGDLALLSVVVAVLVVGRRCGDPREAPGADDEIDTD